jgi:proton-translocating NADH-quinone oxidoreductase chain L
MSPTTQAIWILLLPLVGFVIQIFFGKRLPRQGDFIPTGAIALACLLAWNIFGSEVLLKENGIDIKEVTVISLDQGHRIKTRGRLVKDTGESYILEVGSAAHPRTVEIARETDDQNKVLVAPFYTFKREFKWGGGNWLSTGSKITAGKNAGPSAKLDFAFNIFIDNLTAIMLVVVTTVSFLVHLYSTGYMVHHGHHAPRYNRFFAFLGLFSFSMLGLILTDSLFFLFVFWELVGLCSYFLIGFEFEREAACNAGIKAFITTKIGDCGFFIALMIIGLVVGKFTFAEIFASVEAPGVWAPWLLTLTAILLFIGPIGKSAQFPLHVWLPDAMEGPTPVSALIHAATMVVAGVYLVARMFPFFVGAAFFDSDGANVFHSTPLMVVAYVGGFTSLFAATIALVQDDIKKVLAYSTVSQLGYMILAMGVGSIAAGTMHLWTHAFFKACLFLGAGSVIHAVATNDMKLMGGLYKKMPVTFYTFLISCMAIAGVPLLSGFFSKEAILTQALMFGQENGGIHYMPFAFGMLTAVLTPFYMFRIICMAFMGKPREKSRYNQAHESPWSMTTPLVILATLAVVCAGTWSLSLAWPVAIFPIIVMVVFFGRPLGKPLLIGLLIFGGLYVVPPTVNWVSHLGDKGHAHASKDAHDSPKKDGKAEAEWDSHGKKDAGHGDGHAEAESPFCDFKTSEWFNDRVGNHLFTDQMAISQSATKIFPHALDHKSHATGNLVLPRGMNKHEEHEYHHDAHFKVMMMSLLAATLGIGFCWVLYIGPLRNEVLAPAGGVLAWYRKVLLNLYYMDNLYGFIFVDGVLYIRKGFVWFDRNVIDAFVNWVATAVMDVPQTAAKIDQQAYGLKIGVGMMTGVLGAAGLGAVLATGAYGSSTTLIDSNIPANVLCGTTATILFALVSGICLWLGGVRKGAAALISCIFALCGFTGTIVSHKIAGWAALGPAKMHFLLAPAAANPMTANIVAVLLITLIIGVWAGVGVDGTVRFVSEKFTLGLGRQLRRVQTGRLQDYLLATVLLTVAVIVITALL